MSRELLLVLEDIVSYCHLIMEWASRLTYETFLERPVEYHAIIRA